LLPRKIPSVARVYDQQREIVREYDFGEIYPPYPFEGMEKMIVVAAS
jgi:hypothetical protein